VKGTQAMTHKIALSLAAALATVLAACSAAQLTNWGTSATFQTGQLFCSVATATGPMTVALQNALGVPVLATGLESAVVADACAAWNTSAIPVTPPAGASPATTPTVSAPTPTAATPAAKSS
jgi:hypothetical protein